MLLQNFELKNAKIKADFLNIKQNQPEKLQQRLNFSWSNWGFGMESLKETAVRLEQADIHYIELHGNHYGPNLGYKVKETLDILGQHQIKVGGTCGMFSADNDLSSNRAVHRQAAIDYIKRELEFTAAVGGTYLLVVPGAVGRPKAYDQMEFDRSVETLQIVADLFVQYKIKAAIEPIRSAEASFIHTIAEAQEYIKAVGHPGVQHINADVYHMQVEESHIGEALIAAGDQLVNLHMADSNRGALGDGSLDLDTIIMALYVLGFNREGRYFTPEPLGPGGDPYPAMYGKPDRRSLERMVQQSVTYFREREAALLM
ncbi:sugar phosphate isomerase/epimerase [Paenibacillus psychroresistens]|uniref:Sugar phosphate isomerase/epimerase n=1 Tax=Paenibacillus psychroresistens TaxID=1778678 RepID=A0A6B8RSZ8_9BACL|nr:sugar phosphate isomerase/epimerase [Paenibacillus psychroresistens]QGQ98944.1 sugar phosphate isomerase/epimerase [Paenibacillus psychroresistens]